MRDMKVVLLTAFAAGTLAIAGCDSGSGGGAVAQAPDAGTDATAADNGGGGGDTVVTPDTAKADTANGDDTTLPGDDTVQTDAGPTADTCDCGDRVCGTAPSGTCSCGTCNAPEVCNPMGQCEAPGLPNGSYCGQNADCPAKIPDPQNPGQEIDNPHLADCINAECASKFCMGVGAPGVGVFNQSVCSRPCTISKDDDKNGVEDADAPFSDCDGFTAGPAGDSFRCVEFAPPSSGQTLQYCVATSDFADCTANADCPADEQCIGLFMYDHVAEHCIAKTQAGEWSPTTAKMGESCNEDPFAGDVKLCETGWCFGLGCVDSCNDDTDCDTTKIYPDTGCDTTTGTCKTNADWACTTDAQCSLWTCGLKDAKIFGDSIDYTDDFCWPRGCEFDSDCADGYYCRFNWNGAFDDAGEPVWEHMCLPQAEGGVAQGAPCDEDTSDNIPGDTCLNEDYCVGGYCGGLCQTDADCATDMDQQCVRVEFGATAEDGSDTTLPLDWCQTYKGSQEGCMREQDCDNTAAAGKTEHCELLTKPNGDVATSADMPLTATGVCTESDATLGGMASQCMSGADCESGWCLGADSTAGTAGFCTQMCDSSAACESVPDGSGGSYNGICTSLLVSYGGDKTNPSTNIYVGLCQFSQASLADCSADYTCATAGEACGPNPIAFGPNFSTEVEYLCMSNGTDATTPAGDACDPNAQDAQGNPVAQCATGLCLDEAPGAADAAKGYCSQLCKDENDDSCPDGLSCMEITTIPRQGTKADNAGTFFACMKDQDCTPCVTDGFCPGDRVCVNLGADDKTAADYRCVPACQSDADCANGTTCSDSTDGLGMAVKGCFDVDATSGAPTNFCTAN